MIVSIENKAAKVKLDEVVRKYSVDEITEEIGKVFGAQAFTDGIIEGEICNCAENAADTLDIDIHSPGGSVLDGYILYNALLDLRERGVYVTAHVTLAASMASVIAMAADKVVMRKGARMMIHEASCGAQGDSRELAKQAALLDGISDEIAGIYAKRTGIEKSEVREMMLRETWMDATQAVELGFADAKFHTTEKTKAMSILDRLTKPSDAEAQERIEALESSIESHDSQIQEFQSKVEQAESALQEAVTEAQAIKDEKDELALQLEEAKAKLAELAEQAEAKSKEIEELEKEVVVTDEVVAAKASEVLAETGHPEPVAINDEEVSTISDYEQYRKLQASDPVAASQFWNDKIAPTLTSN